MNLEQCESIIQDLFQQKWPQMAPGGKSAWSAYFIENVIWDAVKSFPEPVARTAAVRLAQAGGYVPTAKKWAAECKGVYFEEKGRENAPVKVPCDVCNGCGEISFRARRIKVDATRLDFADVRHVLDRGCGPGWYSYSIPCECTNAYRKLDGVTPEERFAVIKAVRAFETKTFGRDATELTPERWRYFMEKIGAKIRAFGAAEDKSADVQIAEVLAEPEPEY